MGSCFQQDGIQLYLCWTKFIYFFKNKNNYSLTSITIELEDSLDNKGACIPLNNPRPGRLAKQCPARHWWTPSNLFTHFQVIDNFLRHKSVLKFLYYEEPLWEFSCFQVLLQRFGLYFLKDLPLPSHFT